MVFAAKLKLGSALGSSLAIVISLLALIGLQVPQLNKLTNRSSNASIEELQKEVESEKNRLGLTVKLPSLGYNNLIADWTLLNFFQYFGDSAARDRTGYELIPKYFDTIVERDPHFINSYIFLSTSLSLYAGLPEKSVSLMEKGLKSLSPKQPGSYYVWRYKGIDELLFLGNGKAAQNSFENASRWASIHSDAESQIVASVSKKTAQFLSQSPDLTPAQEIAWSMVLENALNANDRQTVKRVTDRIESQGGKAIVSPDGVIKIELPKSK